MSVQLFRLTDFARPLRAMAGSRKFVRRVRAAVPEEDTVSQRYRHAQQMGRMIDDLLALSQLGRRAMKMSRWGRPAL